MWLNDGNRSSNSLRRHFRQQNRPAQSLSLVKSSELTLFHVILPQRAPRAVLRESLDKIAAKCSTSTRTDERAKGYTFDLLRRRLATLPWCAWFDLYKQTTLRVSGISDASCNQHELFQCLRGKLAVERRGPGGSLGQPCRARPKNTGLRASVDIRNIIRCSSCRSILIAVGTFPDS